MSQVKQATNQLAVDSAIHGWSVFPSSRLIPERKGNGASLHSAMLNFTNRSEIYLYLFTMIPSNLVQFQAPKIVSTGPHRSSQMHHEGQFL